MAIDKRLSFLREKFDSFYSILDATTIPVDDGRRVDGIADAVALSKATEELYAGISAAYKYLIQQHGISTTKYAPEIKHQAERVTITKIPIRADALLMAALRKLDNVVAHSPDNKGNRWHWGDIISTDDLERLDSVNKLLAMPAATGGGATAEPVARSASGSVLLFSRQEKPIVKGTEKDTLTNAQYDVVLALIEAGEKGLTKDELDWKSGHGDARKILKRLADSDSDWEEVIPFPGTTGMGYRIL